MTVTRASGPDYQPLQPRPALAFTVDHWLAIGPIALALLIAVALIVFG